MHSYRARFINKKERRSVFWNDVRFDWTPSDLVM